MRRESKRRIMENSNISPCKNIIFQKSAKRNQTDETLPNIIKRNT
jgi:hypothetical protein